MAVDDETEPSGPIDEPVPPSDGERKPDAPSGLTWPVRRFALKNTFREFMSDNCPDIAATLTYYAMLSLFPALLALVSVLGLVGQDERATDTVLDVLDELGAGGALDTIEPAVERLTASESAGIMLVVGLVVALWSASGYVNAFARAMNVVYEVDEGRPAWKMRPTMLLITAVLLLMAAITAIGLVVSGPVTESIAGPVGLSDEAVTVWEIAKWPVLLAIVMLMVAVLYNFTPNVRQRFRWISIGAFVAVLVWVLATAAFGFYVANFGNYDATYGTLGGVIIFLLWLWLTNLALLFGAELDAEIERGRELQAGIQAEETIQLPPRDIKKIDKDAAKAAKQVSEGRRLREDSEPPSSRP